jgi:hypothetical protein
MNKVTFQTDTHKSIELFPHLADLKQPPDNTLLYKIIKPEHILDMLNQKYLYFNRVDTYNDDKNDSKQTMQAASINKTKTFIHAPDFSVHDFFEQARKRSYACCFSTINSDYIWDNYANNDPNSICIVINYTKLIKFFEERLSSAIIKDQKEREIHGLPFCLNCGLIQYIDYVKDTIYRNNQIKYTYIKDNFYSKENEFRLSLSGRTTGKYLSNGQEFCFPKSILLDFDYNLAIRQGVIVRFLLSPHHKKNFFYKFKQMLSKQKISLEIL